MTSVWVHAEEAGGPTPGLITAARAFGAGIVVFGRAEVVLPAASDLGRAGAGAVVGVEGVGDRLPAGPVAAAVSGAMAGASAVLLAATYDGRDLAGRLSARLGCPVVGNAVGLGPGPEVETAVFGGSVRVRTRFTGPPPWIVTVKPEAVRAGSPAVAARSGGAGAGTSGPEVTVVPAPAVLAPRVVARHSAAAAGPGLDRAPVVVAGGRGLGSGGAFDRVADLARLLGGAPAATRAVVDAGWVPYSWQVGLTGATVAPEVYLAFGISGAAQHLVGMAGARTVVAVNTDRGAPIFTVADLGVVGDALDVLERLVREVRARQEGPGR